MRLDSSIFSRYLFDFKFENFKDQISRRKLHQYFIKFKMLDALKNIENYYDDFDNNYAEELKYNSINPFEMFKISTRELKHSDLLDWMFNPKKGNIFHQKYLYSFLKQLKKIEHPATKKISLKWADENYQTKREWPRRQSKRTLDLIITSADSKWVIAIENKIKDKDTDGRQTTEEYELLAESFEDYTIIPVYLFMKKGKPSSKFINFSYGSLIFFLAKTNNDDISTDHRRFNNQLIKHINENYKKIWKR